eukprot:490001-Prymnesium_polylepis.1
MTPPWRRRPPADIGRSPITPIKLLYSPNHPPLCIWQSATKTDDVAEKRNSEHSSHLLPGARGPCGARALGSEASFSGVLDERQSGYIGHPNWTRPEFLAERAADHRAR